MQIGILSGAVDNAGDFLITKRSTDLIRHIYPNAKLEMFYRNFPLDSGIERLNQCDFLVFCGGPAFQPEIFPGNLQLLENLDAIKPPIYSLGLGWKGKYTDEIYTTYKFSGRTRTLIDRMAKVAPLSCRDWYSVRVLQENGYSDCVMTGCPAWYCLDSFRDKSPRGGNEGAICISDPGEEKNLCLVVPLVEAVQKVFPDSPIMYVMHRNRNHVAESCRVVDKLESMGIKSICIAGSADGFEIYDNCKFHIGFRVHAHIYNLSRGRETVVINEDARGMGVNDALGLENFNIDTIIRRAENWTGKWKIGYQTKDFTNIFQRKAEHYLEMNRQMEGLHYKQALLRIEKYYVVMCDYIKRMH